MLRRREDDDGMPSLFETPLEVGGAHISAPQGALDVLLEESPVCLQNLCCLLVQRILRVRLLEEETRRGDVKKDGGGEKKKRRKMERGEEDEQRGEEEKRKRGGKQGEEGVTMSKEQMS